MDVNMSENESAESVRISWVPNLNDPSRPTRKELDNAIPLDGWTTEDQTIEFYRDDVRFRYYSHPLSAIIAEDPTPWEQFRLNDGRTGRFRRVNDGDLQIIVDSAGTYDADEFVRLYQNREVQTMTESMPEPQRRDVEEEDGVIRTTWVLADGTESDFGPVEMRLRQEIGELKLTGQLSGTLVSAAYALARKLDRD